MKNKIKYTDFYKLPLKIDDYVESIVWTKENRRAFDFSINEGLNAGEYYLSTEEKKRIVEIINGNNNFSLYNKFEFIYDENSSSIYIKQIDNKKMFISIRGWGGLTGTGGLNLKEETARKMQDDFAKFIISRLQNNNN